MNPSKQTQAVIQVVRQHMGSYRLISIREQESGSEDIAERYAAKADALYSVLLSVKNTLDIDV